MTTRHSGSLGSFFVRRFKPTQTIVAIKTKPSKSKMTKLKNLRVVSLNTSTDGRSLLHRYATAPGKGVLKPYKNSILISMNMEEHQRPLNKRQEKREMRRCHNRDVPQGYSLTKESIPRAIQVCPIPGDNVPEICHNPRKRGRC